MAGPQFSVLPATSLPFNQATLSAGTHQTFSGISNLRFTSARPAAGYAPARTLYVSVTGLDSGFIKLLAPRLHFKAANFMPQGSS
jgi:hypothetical protein